MFDAALILVLTRSEPNGMFNSGVKCSAATADETAFTVVVLGLNRGGTSAIAQVLTLLGLPMGRHAPAPVYEDRALADAFRAKNWRLLSQLLQAYQAELGCFGWKLPESFTQLPRIERSCLNPRYVVVYRDIFAIANRQEQVGLHDCSSAMVRSLAGYQTIVEFVAKSRRPVLHLSYEKLLHHPEVAVRALLDFCQLTADETHIAAAIAAFQPSPASYLRWVSQTQSSKALSQQGYLGYLDAVSAQRITGWVVQNASPRHVEVQLYINGNWQQTTTANIYRPDVQHAGHSPNGLAGYMFTPAQPLQPKDQVSVRICPSPDTEMLELIGSPLVVAG